MLEQYYVQYDLDGCCLRAPWIMEKDDFRYQLSSARTCSAARAGATWSAPSGRTSTSRADAVPVMLDPDGRPVKRNFVHVDDLVDAILARHRLHPSARKQTFNICMDEPVDYGELAAYLERVARPADGRQSARRTTRPGSTTPRRSSCSAGGPQYDLQRMIDAAWDYQRHADEPRVVWYPG